VDDGGLSLRFVLTVSIADTVLVIALMVALTRAHGESVTRLWLDDRPLRPEVILGVILVPFVFLLVVVLLNLLRMFAPWLHNVPVNPLEELASTPGEATAFAMVAIFAGGVREELQRAFLLHRFRSDLGRPWMGVFITSLAFGLGHTLQGLDAAVITGALGALWGAMYLVRGSAVAPMVSHSLFNSSELLRVFFR
jgi:membrane protease YdiL (CAAX protease family)